MRLLDKLNRRVGDREYRKWYLSLPNAHVKRLGWSHGQELKTRIDGNMLVIEPADADGARSRPAGRQTSGRGTRPAAAPATSTGGRRREPRRAGTGAGPRR